MMNFGLSFHEIPVSELQKVATERCAIHPKEVADDLLLAAEGGSTSNNH
jgi:hypothetical protein